jgi:hypothetical protein
MPCLPTLPAPCWPRCGRFHRAALAAGRSLTESRWLDVLHDPRARWRTEKRLSATGRYAHLRLDRWRRPMMTLMCRLCGVHKSFDTEQVMKQFGEDYGLQHQRLRHDPMPCERRHSDHVFGACHLERTLSPPSVVAPAGFHSRCCARSTKTSSAAGLCRHRRRP